MTVDPHAWNREDWHEKARTAAPGPKDPARGRGPGFVLSAQHPRSTLTGEAVLRAGGSAVDAVVAMSAVDTVVQPGTSTLGGHLTMLVHDTPSGRTETLNAGFNALIDDREPFDRIRERSGGRAVLVPGLIAGLDAAWRRHGRRPWSELWGPAAHFAREGFPLSAHYRLVARSRQEVLTRHPEGRAIFADLFDDAVAERIFRQPQLADTLDQIVDGIAVNSARYLQGASAEPGERIPEALATQLVLDAGRPVFAATAIGSGLHGCLMQTTISMLAHGLDPHQAADQDRWGFYDYDYRTGRATDAIQTEPFTAPLLDQVERLGQPLARADAAARPYTRRDRPRPGYAVAPTIGS